MKVRQDFVTNSSSSSFILAFDTDKDYERFSENCEWLGYEGVRDIVRNSLLNHTQPEQKDNARELLHRYFERGKYFDQVIGEKFPLYKTDRSEIPYTDIWNFEKSEEYKNRIEELISNDEEYQTKLKRINDAFAIVETMIWDTSGGVLEWAIRHGFLDSEFYMYLILRWNIG